MTHTSIKLAFLSAVGVGLLACTTVPDVMDIPTNFTTQSDKIRIKGARAWKIWGTLSLADVEAKYKRSASTTTWFDTYETKKAKAKFNMVVGGDQIKAKCTMTQKKMYLARRNFGVIGKYIDPSITRTPMKYVCNFEGANIPSDATFVLAQARSNSLRPFGQDEVKRFGYMDWDGQTLEFESGHRPEGAEPSRFFEDFTPAMGYFVYDGADMVAAIDLESKQYLYMTPGIPTKTRNAIMVATTALVLHTDPTE